MKAFNTNYKYVTILGVNYNVVSPTAVSDIYDPRDIININQFNWDNISMDKVAYSND